MDAVMEKNDLYKKHMRHGGAYDRGSADKYYNRAFDPHYYVGGSYMSKRVELKDMTAEEITAYTVGYREQVETKDWR